MAGIPDTERKRKLWVCDEALTPKLFRVRQFPSRQEIIPIIYRNACGSHENLQRVYDASPLWLQLSGPERR